MSAEQPASQPADQSVAQRSEWRPATVVYNQRAASDMVALGVRPETWITHRAGQHYELRFPGEELSRSFSIVSSPAAEGVLEFGIQILPSGLLSPRLAACAPGSQLELRGPIGAGFVWSPQQRGPVLLLGAGAGITPLLSIFEHVTQSAPGERVRFLLSAKAPERVYRFERYRSVIHTRFTATEPRIDKAFLTAALAPVLGDRAARAWLCGPPGFIDAVVDDLIELGFPEERIRSESFV